MKPRYIIVAGVNGAGKSTLYSTNPELFADTRRLNADERLREFGGDWRCQRDTNRAMKSLVVDLKKSLINRESIHHETTLSGTGKPFLSYINLAHQNGYEVTLLYVYINDPGLAFERVVDRVKKGGHGVEESVLFKRYETSLKNFKILSSSVDEVKVYDNSNQFMLVYYKNGDEVIYCSELAKKIFEEK